MANIIPCNEIENKIDELKLLFEPCYKLKADDIDLLSDLVFSASLCSSSDSTTSITNQNNIFKSLKMSSSELSNEDPSIFINNLPLFNVADIEILDVINEYTTLSNDSYSFELRTDYYFLKLGKGSYGINGTQVTKDDFLLYKSNINSSTILTQLNSPRIEFLTGDIDNPANEANLEDSYTITNDRDLFFIISSPQIDTLPQSKKIYRFVGEGGIYGLNGIQFIDDNFLLVEDLSLDENGNTQDTSNFINIIEYRVGFPINENSTISDISKAVNLSFNLPLFTSDNTIHRFIVDKQINLPNGGIQLNELIYDWKGKSLVITEDNNEESDYSLIEEKRIFNLFPDQSNFNPPQLISIEVTDLDNPSLALNNFEEDVIVNDNDLYVRLFLQSNPLSNNSNSNNKLYRFLGDNGIYGNNNTNSVPSEFLEINPDEGIEDKISRTLFITSDDLDSCETCDGETLEDRIAQYITQLNIEKLFTDAELWIEYEEVGGVFTSEFTSEFQ